MKSAKEMFEELGYDRDFHISSIRYYNYQLEQYVWFYQDTETIEIQFDFDLKILQAINKQVEELWGGNDA